MLVRGGRDGTGRRRVVAGMTGQERREYGLAGEARYQLEREELSLTAYRDEAATQDRDALARDDNAASAPGKVCELCGREITAHQEARLLPDGEWIHEAC